MERKKVLEETNRVRESVKTFVGFLESSPFNEAIYYFTAMRLEMQEIAALGSLCLEAAIKIEDSAKAVANFTMRLNQFEETLKKLSRPKIVKPKAMKLPIRRRMVKRK